MDSSDAEDEVFFGPVLGQEAKKAAKLRRKTEIFKPDFRHHLPSTSSSASSDLGEDNVFDEASAEQDSTNRRVVDRTGSAGISSAGSVDESRSDIFADGSFRSSPHVTLRSFSERGSMRNSPLPRGVDKAGKGRAGEERGSPFERSGFRSPHVTLRSFSERSSLRESPIPRSVEKTRTGKAGDGGEDEKESPFQRKTRALLDLIHKTKEEWSSPTQSPLSVCSTDTPLKRKLQGSISAASPLLGYAGSPHSGKVAKLASGVSGHKGGEHLGDRDMVPPEGGSSEGDNDDCSRSRNGKAGEFAACNDQRERDERSESGDLGDSELTATGDSPLENDSLSREGSEEQRTGQFEVKRGDLVAAVGYREQAEVPAADNCAMEEGGHGKRNSKEIDDSSDISGSGKSPSQSAMETDDSRLVSIDYKHSRVAALGESLGTDGEGSYVFGRKPSSGPSNQRIYQSAPTGSVNEQSREKRLPGVDGGSSFHQKNQSETSSLSSQASLGSRSGLDGSESSTGDQTGGSGSSGGSSDISREGLDIAGEAGKGDESCAGRSSAFQPVRSGLTSLSASQEPLQIVPFQTSTPTQPSARSTIFSAQNSVTTDYQHHSFKSDSEHSMVGSESSLLASRIENGPDKFLAPKSRTGKVALAGAGHEPHKVRFSPILQDCTNIVSRRDTSSRGQGGRSPAGSPSTNVKRGQGALATPTHRGVENEAGAPVNLFAPQQGGSSSASSSSVSLRKRLLEQKQAQLMKVKQAKAELEQRILETDEQQFQLRMGNMSALRSTMDTLKEYIPSADVRDIQDSPSTSLDEGSFDELTKYCTWRNSQLIEDGNPGHGRNIVDEGSFDELTKYCTWRNSQLIEDGNPGHETPPIRPSKMTKGGNKSHLQWMENLVVEVAELSSPSKPATRGKSILMNK